MTKVNTEPFSGPSRRSALATGLVTGALAVTSARAAPAPPAHPEAPPSASTLTFGEIAHGLDDHHAVSPQHNVQVLLRWGDAISDKAPAWSPTAQSAGAQRLQFGYDSDFIAYMPLPYGSASSERGLLCINNEATRNQLMFPGFTGRRRDDLEKDLVDVEVAAHGHTIVEVAFRNGAWNVELSSPFNRRFTGFDTFDVGGPAAGHTRLRTRDDPAGREVLGTLSNCAGGVTPWGTVLTAEENVNLYFSGDPRKTAEAANHLAMGLGGDRFYGWNRFYPRFDVEQEPHEPNRFAWMVEIDPYDANVRPVKRTALGRFKHEGAGVAVNRDGRIACYMGDDEIFQFIYKFVSAKAYDASDRGRNWGLLDDGTLYAARFNKDRTVTWLPLTWGAGLLTRENGFNSQADVLIETRRAAALVGATIMDRPEDIEVDPDTGHVYVSLTKNARRTAEQTDAVNPRMINGHGHIVELIPPRTPEAVDHAATTCQWRFLLLAGNPKDASSGAQYNADVSQDGWLSCPDNLAFDPKGRLWIGTDGGNTFGHADGVWATDVTGPGRALTRHFFRCPIGAEFTGPAFTPDGTTMFGSVQHPGDTNGSSFVTPATRWPDFKDGIPPRPSVVAIRRRDGGPIG